MARGVIPADMETELMPKDVELPTWQSILAYCRKRTTNLRYKELSEQVQNQKPAARGLGSKVNTFTSDDKQSYSEAAQSDVAVPQSGD